MSPAFFNGLPFVSLSKEMLLLVGHGCITGFALGYAHSEGQGHCWLLEWSRDVSSCDTLKTTQRGRWVAEVIMEPAGGVVVTTARLSEAPEGAQWSLCCCWKWKPTDQAIHVAASWTFHLSAPPPFRTKVSMKRHACAHQSEVP